jgi:hypothetical protein
MEVPPVEVFVGAIHARHLMLGFEIAQRQWIIRA